MIGKGPCPALLAEEGNFFKEAPSTKDEEGQEEEGGEVVQGGDHHTFGACAFIHCEVEAGTAGGNWEGVVEVGESQGAGDDVRR